MKKIAAIIVTLVIYPGISSAAQGTAAPQETAILQEAETPAGTVASKEPAKTQKAVGRLYVMRGSVTVGDNTKVNISKPVVSGMMVKTGENSAALLKFDDGQVVTMQSSTTFQVREYHYDAENVENSKIDLAFFDGGVRLVTGLIGQKKRLAFSLLTPNATIRGDVAKLVVVKADNLIYSKVQDGDIRITNSAGTAYFTSGEYPVVPSSLRLASEFYAKTPRGIFNELLSIPVAAPLIAEPAPARSLAPANASPAGSASAPVAVPAPSPVTASAPSAEPAPVQAPAPVLAPASAAIAEPLPAPAPAAVHATATSPSVAPVPVSASVLVSAQEPPSCTCTCTFSNK